METVLIPQFRRSIFPIRKFFIKIKALCSHTTGGPEVLKQEHVGLSSPAAGAVRIRHTAIGFNFQDFYTRGGMYPAPMPVALPSRGVTHLQNFKLYRLVVSFSLLLR